MTAAGRWILLLAALSLPLAGSAEITGEPAPDFVLRGVDGPNLRLSEYRGRVVLLGFWASWCGDCRAQIKALVELNDRYAGAGFDLVTVSLDGDSRQAEQAIDSLDIDFPVLHDPDGHVGETYGVEHMPYVALIDRDGIVRAEFSGYRRGDADKYVEQLKRLLAE